MNLEIIHVGLLGTNCYVSWDEDKNCVVVDCGGDADKVADFIREKGLTPTHLLLTHGHGDHMGGAADLKEIFPQIKIVLGERDLEMIGDGEKSMSNAVAPYAKAVYTGYSGEGRRPDYKWKYGFHRYGNTGTHTGWYYLF